VILTCSAILAVIHFAMSLIIVPHIFGLLISVTMIITNVLYIVYIVKIKKRMNEDYKVQYEMMGRKHKGSCLSKSITIGALVSYVTLNGLMMSMVILRGMSIKVSDEFYNRTSFPYMCPDSAGEACTRMVLTKNSCYRVESLTDRFTLVYKSRTSAQIPIGFYATYCAQSIGISSL
jgi:cytochrome c biogenesis factor